MLTYKNIFLRVSSTKVKENTALIDRKEHWERCSLVSTFIHSFLQSSLRAHHIWNIVINTNQGITVNINQTKHGLCHQAV